MISRTGAINSARKWLMSLARNTRGNTLAIVAASVLPLAGMVGGGVDISRMYIVKTRLQHACDAGTLAGRKQMGGGTWAFNSNAARTAAERFFDANIQANPYGATSVTRTFTEYAGKVSGVASATVPMTIMRIFGKTNETLTVACDAEMRLPNTDVMFVLDVTGSMANKAVSSDSQTKIEALRSSVKCFYEIVARLDTDETCVTGTPSGGTGNTTQVRFGFVPYDMNVNVGRSLPTSMMADTWPYQSRERTTVNGRFTIDDGTLRAAGSYSGYSTQQSQTLPNGSNSVTCSLTYLVPLDDFTSRGVASTTSWPTDETSLGWRGYVVHTQRNWRVNYTSGSRLCALQYRERSVERRGWYARTNDAPNGTTVVPFPAWTYRQTTLDVTGLKNGTDWNSAVTLPIGNNHTNASIAWNGCIEERATVRQASYTPLPAGAQDLDIDSAPSAGVPGSYWGPALVNAIYPRRWSDLQPYTSNGTYTLDTITTFNQSYSGEGHSCPTAAKKLQPWTDASAFSNYVDNMWGGGNTYHDIGLIWGARLISPTGLFRSENEFTPGGGEIERHVIFMTDGEACTENYNYQAYGMAWFDRRQTPEADVPSGGCVTSGTLTQQVNARTQAICTAVKNKNITLWVIWFGASSATIEGLMQSCATPGRYFAARNSADLQNTFASIANQISQLRLTK